MNKFQKHRYRANLCKVSIWVPDFPPHLSRGMYVSMCARLSLEALLWAGGGTVRLRQWHNAVRTLQVRLDGLLIGRFQSLKQVLCLSAVVPMKSPITSVHTDKFKRIPQPTNQIYKENQIMKCRAKLNVQTKVDLLSGYRSGLRVSIMNSFLDGLSENCNMPRIIRKHG